MGLPLQSQSESESFGFGRGPPPQGQQHQLRVGPPLQGDFVRRVVPRPAPTRGRGTSGLHTNAIRSDEIPLQRRPSQPWCSPFRRAKSLAQSRSHSRQSVLDGIDEATDMQVAKDAVVRGSGASRPWMACARLLEPGMAQPGDANDPRTAAAPPEGDKSRRFGSGQKPASPHEASGLRRFSAWPDPESIAGEEPYSRPSWWARHSWVHTASMRCSTFGSRVIGRPHSRADSAGHLRVASRPSLEPRPDTGVAKSK